MGIHKEKETIPGPGTYFDEKSSTSSEKSDASSNERK
jgi:hypothetical protein